MRTLLVPIELADEEEQILSDDDRQQSQSPDFRRPWWGARVLASALLLGLALWRCAPRGEFQESGVSKVVMLDAAGQEHCHTALPGESCWLDVNWAMTQGIVGHPDWYEGPCPDLSRTSSFEEFQTCVVRINMTTCPLPCNPANQIANEVVARVGHEHAAFNNDGGLAAPCHTASPGDDCYQHVLQAMVTGIVKHPERFPGLNRISTFEEFQSALHQDAQFSALCPRPCECHTALQGEPCYKHIMWAKETGIAGHPDWYRGVTPESSFEEIQAYLHRDAHGSCRQPCTNVDPVAALAAMPGALADADAVADNLDAGAAGPGAALDAGAAGPGGGVGVDADCNEASWPDLRNGLVCGKCRVLVNRFDTYWGTCDAYCSDMGRACTGAWEEIEDTCQVLRIMGCEETSSSSDAICECGEKVSLDGAVAPRVPSSTSSVSEEGDDVERQIEQELLVQTTSSAFSEFEPEPRTFAPYTTTEQSTFGAFATTTLSAFGQEGGSYGFEEGACHTAKEGEKCYKDVLYGMQEGIYQHPEWYDGLKPHNSFEEFQRVLHDNPHVNCPKPCTENCYTAREGEKCRDNIKWVLRKGIAEKPGWYAGLTEKSRFEEVQERLYEDRNSSCSKPCTARPWGKPSLFCIAVFRSEGYERELVTAQLEKQIGIFACDEFAVLSDKKLPLTEEIETLVIPPCEHLGTSKDGTAANTLVFMQAWTVIYGDVRWKAHDWIIKADPDAVIIPLRMRQHLAPHTGQNVYIKNCMKCQGPGWPMMFGSVEAFSSLALDTYYKGAQRCRDQLQWQAWGEDLFMAHCLDMLGAWAPFDGTLVGDQVCKGGNCGDHAFAAYHPYKSVDSWMNCYNQAMR